MYVFFGGIEMKLQEAEEQSAEIVELLKPFCKKILVVGSIRRKKPECKDIDKKHKIRKIDQKLDLKKKL